MINTISQERGAKSDAYRRQNTRNELTSSDRKSKVDDHSPARATASRGENIYLVSTGAH